jgi:hypothetical protein
VAEYERDSIAGVIRSLLDDTRELIREEVLLARAEIREELAALQTVGMSFAVAAMAALIGTVLLSIAIGGALAYLLDWPTWSGYLIVALLMLASAVGLVVYARGQLATLRTPLPKTTETLKENMAWIKSKSAKR